MAVAERRTPGSVTADATPAAQVTETHKHVYNYIAKYAKASWPRSLWELGSTLVVLVSLFWLNKWWLSVLSGLTFLRLFIQFHDMSHLSFFPWSAVNSKLGTILGGPVLTPFGYWKYHHDYHHRHSNDLDFLQTSQTAPMTYKQYCALTLRQQRLYSLFTSRPMMLSVTPVLIWVFFMTKYRRHDVGYWLVYVATCVLTGRLTVALLSAWVGAVCGTYLFHMQHTFQPAVRERGRDYFDNGLHGSSLVDIPWFLKWFSCGIEYHHIHHLNAKVPSYRMRECHDNAPAGVFDEVVRLDVLNGLEMLNYNCWDEDASCFRCATPSVKAA
eukprot:TRINITY_DN12257_c0_g1_i1.p1 TRINITY_DN12257_c0_g1~~TRINITY_DN12257_c0_g1_i1.p1  ORF type:complete len:327 (+),score=91.33 TRINITY_DN12257_c0_g1_i1:103-1083(+)